MKMGKAERPIPRAMAMVVPKWRAEVMSSEKDQRAERMRAGDDEKGGPTLPRRGSMGPWTLGNMEWMHFWVGRE